MSISLPNILLENYTGPLDLLLYLIQKSEIDICSIQIQEILGQFLNLVSDNEEDRVNSGAEFVSTTSTLLLIKSQRLLPKDQQNQLVEETDPRFETIQKLLEYCRFKELSQSLHQKQDTASIPYPRGAPIYEPKPHDRVGIEHLEVQQLQDVMTRIIQRLQPTPFSLKEEWKVADKIKFIRALVNLNDLELNNLFINCESKFEIIATFLAILELMKNQEITLINEDKPLIKKKLKENE
ncbi:MAG: segregation/condensation protein A [Parachlamydiales bacterium]|nr:segregation/condensation protein A [Parachlamydiales bacterium]